MCPGSSPPVSDPHLKPTPRNSGTKVGLIHTGSTRTDSTPRSDTSHPPRRRTSTTVRSTTSASRRWENSPSTKPGAIQNRTCRPTISRAQPTSGEGCPMSPPPLPAAPRPSEPVPPLRQVRADFDDETLTVYQAYSAAIAVPAATRNSFDGTPFKLDRMTWIKPSFFWMMYRSGWATKPGQEHVLAIRITREGFEDALAQACPTQFDPDAYSDCASWQEHMRASSVRVHRRHHGSSTPDTQIGPRRVCRAAARGALPFACGHRSRHWRNAGLTITPSRPRRLHQPLPLGVAIQGPRPPVANLESPPRPPPSHSRQRAHPTRTTVAPPGASNASSQPRSKAAHWPPEHEPRDPNLATNSARLQRLPPSARGNTPP